MQHFRGLTLAISFAAAARLSAQTNTIVMTTQPGSLVIASVVPGSAPTASSDQARYSVAVVGVRKKIMGHLDASLPAGITLRVQLTAPTGAISLGTITLTTVPQDLVRFIPVGSQSGLSVTFELSAPVTAGVVPFSNRSIVLTLVEDP